VILDCVDDNAKAFYSRFDFRERRSASNWDPPRRG
jgi:hypothetical protein